MKFNKEVFKATLNVAKTGIKKKSPVICLVLGLGAMGYAIYSAAKAAPKAEKAISEAEEQKGSELTAIEKIKVGGKYYIPCAVAGLAGAGFILGENHILDKRMAGLEAAYAIASEQLVQRISAEEETGHAEEIATKVVEKTLAESENKCPVQLKTTDDGDLIDDIYDKTTGTMYRGSRNDIITAAGVINNTIYNSPFDGGTVSVNRWRIEAGLEPCDFGEVLGFDKTHPCMPVFQGGTNPINGKLCYILSLKNPPISI